MFLSGLSNIVASLLSCRVKAVLCALRSLCAGIVLLVASAYPSTSQEDAAIRIVTEEFPPYDYAAEDGSVEGLATDVVKEALRDLGLIVEIEILPWARAIRLASQEPNVMLYSVVRTAEREDKFHWVGVVCEVRSFLFKLKRRTDIPASDLTQLRDYSVGVVRGWAGQSYLRENGFTDLQAVAVSEFNIKKLFSGRVDLIEDYEANVIYQMKRLELDYGELEKAYFNADISGPLFAVFSRQTSDKLVDSFKRAFSQIHLDGRYDEIRARWLSAGS